MPSYSHTIRRHARKPGRFVLRWWLDQFHRHRGVVARSFERETDEAGARKFAARWECDMPGDREDAT